VARRRQRRVVACRTWPRPGRRTLRIAHTAHSPTALGKSTELMSIGTSKVPHPAARPQSPAAAPDQAAATAAWAAGSTVARATDHPATADAVPLLRQAVVRLQLGIGDRPVGEAAALRHPYVLAIVRSRGTNPTPERRTPGCRRPRERVLLQPQSGGTTRCCSPSTTEIRGRPWGSGSVGAGRPADERGLRRCSLVSVGRGRVPPGLDHQHRSARLGEHLRRSTPPAPERRSHSRTGRQDRSRRDGQLCWTAAVSRCVRLPADHRPRRRRLPEASGWRGSPA